MNDEEGLACGFKIDDEGGLDSFVSFVGRSVPMGEEGEEEEDESEVVVEEVEDKDERDSNLALRSGNTKFITNSSNMDKKVSSLETKSDKYF